MRREGRAEKVNQRQKIWDWDKYELGIGGGVYVWRCKIEGFPYEFRVCGGIKEKIITHRQN